ncbi:MAG: cytochrome c biogenesis protein CcsA [Deltaproteobacteria bacterium]|nr:cytochrome c biogenesis protein CcsA [Deltaproteobacteria bacterium]
MADVNVDRVRDAEPVGAIRVVQQLGRIEKPVGVLAALGVLVAFGMIAAYAPLEVEQGEVQKIFYVHVPSAWTAFLAVTVVFLASILFLLTRDRVWDEIAASAGEIALVFLSIVLTTGPLWGRPVWNTWWTWDARLTYTLILWLVFAAYQLVRPFAADSERGARFAAVLSIVGFVDLPIIHFSVLWWRTLHPKPIVMDPVGGKHLDPAMFQTLMFTLGAWTLLFLFFLAKRVQIEHRRNELGALGR